MTTLDKTLRNLKRKLERVLAERDAACFNEWALQKQIWRLETALDDAGIDTPILGITRQGELLASPAEH